MHDPLAPLLLDGVIDEVVARLKSGKEADLWIVRHRGEAIAAKVYKARQTRSFRNDAAYREGRQVRDTRTQRAMDRGSRFGQAAAEEAWKAKEADALHALHAAGMRVPRPVMFYEGVLLMELVLDANGHPAPRLIDAQVEREQAAAMYADLRAQVVRMLGCDLIHGDLSPYNVLVAANGPVIIDFPQVVGAAHNSQAEAFFLRDLENLRHFFASLDPALQAAAGDAREIWRAYVRRELTADFVPTGREPPPQKAGPGPGAAGRGQPHGGAHRAHPHGGGPQPQRDRAGAERRGPRGEPAAPSRGEPPPHGRGERPAHGRGEQRAVGAVDRGHPHGGGQRAEPHAGSPPRDRGAPEQRGGRSRAGAARRRSRAGAARRRSRAGAARRRSRAGAARRRSRAGAARRRSRAGAARRRSRAGAARRRSRAGPAPRGTRARGDPRLATPALQSGCAG